MIESDWDGVYVVLGLFVEGHLIYVELNKFSYKIIS